MKNLLLILFVSVAFMACGGKGKSAAELARLDSLRKDSIMKDSIAKANFTSPDLITFDLKGPVQTVIVGGNEDKITFDENGTIVSHSATLVENISRNDEGYIESIYITGESQSFDYDLEVKKLKSVTGGDGGYSYTRTYEYNEAGDVITEKWKTVDEVEGSSDSGVNQIEITKRDNYGNWIERKVGVGTETRQITYYK